MLNWKEVLRLAKEGSAAPAQRVEKSDAEWRRELSDEEYRVTRTAGTERPFSSAMCGLFEPGTYACRCCGTILFDSSSKFVVHPAR
jgi:peptide-methionine (R)-S-oxide reductase